MDNIQTVFSDYLSYASQVFSALSDPENRLFIGFLLTSLITAYILYLRRAKGSGFREFLFPDEVWSHPTAWLDVRYFFFHSLIGKFLIFGAGTTALSAGIFSGINIAGDIGMMSAIGPENPALRMTLAITAMIILFLVADFMSFYLHYLQHKIPLLWQFHKVHHSGEVMHPLSNFREHPVDNLTYEVVGGLVVGIIFGILISAFGYKPTLPKIVGYSAFGLFFNAAAYSLRHSHIWLRWPGNWSKVLGSPAHHQVHHSRHPDHLDKNFAFMLPIWDVLFKTYEMPEDNRDVEYGIVGDSSELNSCVNLYVIPFRDAYHLLKSKKTAEPLSNIESEKTS